MIIKSPKSGTLKWLKRGAGVFFVCEALAFAASYGIWHQINTRRDFRKYLHSNYPLFLEYYYKLGEKIDSDCKVRQIDTAYWEAEQPN